MYCTVSTVCNVLFFCLFIIKYHSMYEYSITYFGSY